MDDKKKEEEQKINDYLKKLELLSKAIIDERATGQNYLNLIRGYEKTLIEKDNEITNLERKKCNFQKELQAEKARKKAQEFSMNKVFDRVFHKEKFTKEKYDKLVKENHDLKEKNTQIEHDISDQQELYMQSKAKFRSILTLETIKQKDFTMQIDDLQNEIKEAKEEYINKSKTLNELQIKQDEYNEKLKEHDKQVENSKSILDEAIGFYNETKKNDEGIDNKIKILNNELTQLQQEITKVALDCKKTLEREEFAVMNNKDKKIMKIIFDNNNGELRIIVKKNDGEKILKFSDVEKFQIDESDLKTIIFEYNIDKYKESLKLHSHPKLTYIIIDTFNSFNNKSKESENNKVKAE